MTEEVLKFDLTPIEIPVEVGQFKYTLKEATGEAVGKYRDAILDCTKLGPDGKPVSVKGLSGVEPLLVSMCLMDEENKSVRPSVIQAWPNKIQKALFEKIKEISELDEFEEDTDAVKNE